MADADDWAAAVRRVADAAVVLVIGESDTGKTTLVTALANTAAGAGLSVGVVDADVGQSAIGPPTTVSLGRAPATLARLSDAELVALYFAGVTSPARNLLGVVVGTGLMVDRARAARFDRIVVDTGGLVAGGLGRALKQAKIELIDPDVVLCLERRTECEPIVGAYAAAHRPAVVRLRPSPDVVPRGTEQRRRYREERLKAYFARVREIALDLARIVVRLPGGEAVPAQQLAVAPGTIVGLESRTRATLGLGLCKDIDAAASVMLIDAAVPAGEIATVRIGRETFAR